MSPSRAGRTVPSRSCTSHPSATAARQVAATSEASSMRICHAFAGGGIGSPIQATPGPRRPAERWASTGA